MREKGLGIMRAGTGFSDSSDTGQAGEEAVKEAIANAGGGDPDLVFLFATVSHDPRELQEAVRVNVGENTFVVGGCSVGVFSNDRYGISKYQVGCAAVYLKNSGCAIRVSNGTDKDPRMTGRDLGYQLVELGVSPSSASMIMYDAEVGLAGGTKMYNVIPLMAGMEEVLGFLPFTMVGAGMQGTIDRPESYLWTGESVVENTAVSITFSDEVRIDSVIMHGGEPTPEVYTVTKAEGETILEIDDHPALSYISERTKMSPDNFPLCMVFGMDCGIDEVNGESRSFINRMCRSVDESSDVINMFEADMVEGTPFHVMYRNVDQRIIVPNVNCVFDKVLADVRTPVLGFYINCIGRIPEYSSMKSDALYVQEAVAGRVPLLGWYSSSEIAPIMMMPRVLCWTGVFCLISI